MKTLIILFLTFVLNTSVFATICQQNCIGDVGQITFELADKTCPDKAQETYSCAPYKCDEQVRTCRSFCRDNLDCAKGFLCDKNRSQCFKYSLRCLNYSMTISTTGERRDCSPYRCNMGTCLGACQSNSDCKLGITCNLEQHICNMK